MKISLQLLILVLPIAVDASVYKWVDDDGKVHYGDRPRDSQAAVEMTVDDTDPVPSNSGNDGLSRAEKRERLLQSMTEDRLEKQEKREQEQARKEQNRQKCNRYRDRMRHYQRASSLYRLDRDGNRVYMSESDRASATKDLQAKIKRYCR